MERIWRLALAVCFVVGACSTQSNEQDTTPEPMDAAGAENLPGEIVAAQDLVPEVMEAIPPYTVATYNVGLVKGYVPLAQERLPHLLEAVPTLEADFICLQEVWEVADVEAFQAALLESYPHQLTLDTTAEPGESDPACTTEETDPLLACVNEHCADTDDLTSCVMDNCVAEFTSVSKPCSNCLVANIAKPVEEIINSCLTGSAAFTADGRNGLMLLSRHPFASTNSKVLDSFIVRRAVLHARVESEGGPVNVFCTHLTAALSEVEYDGKFDSWKDEQAQQISLVIDFADTHAGEEPAFILGDMNCGPAAGDDIVADNADNFELYAAAGYQAPYLSQDDTSCSWCASNPLSDAADNRLIDHILVKNLGEAAKTLMIERIFDDPITVVHPDSGQEVETYLSDHFGMRAYLP